MNTKVKGDGCWGSKVTNGITYIRYIKWIGIKSRKKVEVCGKTEQECVRKMKAKEREYADEEALVGNAVKPSQNKAFLQDLIWSWLITYKKPILKPKSFDTLAGTYTMYIENTPLGRTEIRNVRTDVLMDLLSRTAEKKSYSTTKKLYNLLGAFFKHYYRICPGMSPMIGVEAPTKLKIILIDEDGITDNGEMKVLSDEEINKFMTEINKENTSMCYMLAFGLWTFMRLGEMQAIQMKDIDLEKGTVNIYKSFSRVRKDGYYSGDKGYEWKLVPPKTKKSRRVVYLCPEARKALENHLRMLKTKRIDIIDGAAEIPPETFIFSSLAGNPYATQNLNDLLKKTLKRADIKTKISVHGLRHTGISYFLRHGADLKTISAQAGHSNLTTTINIYYSITKDQIEGNIDKYWETLLSNNNNEQGTET
jgi:integrase